ncbi:MAG: hypothetical protein P1P85_02460 [Patescibacteria group bacterium]|nr:hypothetical protein [Patescibacteria group bacterium]
MRTKNRNFIEKILSFLKVKQITKQKQKFLSFLFLIIMFISIPLHNVSAKFPNMKWPEMDFLSWNPMDAILNSIYAVVYVLSAIVLYISYYLVWFGAWLIDIMISPSIYTSVLDISSGPLMIGWGVVRDFSNTFFVFILLLIAFSTILRVQKYSAKNFLPKFVIAMFLINFSAVIAAVVIDFGQVFMYEIISWMGSFAGNNGAMGNLTSIVDKMIINFPAMEKPVGGYSLENMVGVTFALVFTIILGFVYIMLAIFLLIRLVVLAILIVLSPVAFIGVILPGLSSQVSMWWKKLFEYSLFGPIFVFFVFLASSMANGLTSYPTPLIPDELNGIKYLIPFVVPYCISIGMLLAVIPVTKTLGMAGSGAIIGGTTGLGKIAMGTYAGYKLAKGLGKRAGGIAKERSEKARKSADVLQTGKEWLKKKLPGGKVRNVKNKAEQEKNKEDKMKKTREKLGREEDRELSVMFDITKGAILKFGLPATPEEKAATAETAIFNGKVLDNKSDLQKMMPAIESALSKKELKDNTHKDLNFALMTSKSQKRINNVDNEDKDKMDKDIKEQFVDGISDDKKRELVEEQIMRETVREMKEDGKDISKLNNLDDKRVSRVINDTLDSEDKRSFENRLTKKQQKEFATGLAENGKTKEEIDELEALVDTGSDEEKEAAKEELKKDEDLKIDAVNFGADLKEVFAKSGPDMEKHIKKAFPKFNSDVVAKLSDTDLLKFGAEATSSQVHHLNRNGKEDKLKVIREAKDNKINTLKSLTPNYNYLESKRRALEKEEDPDKKIIIKKNIEYILNLPDVKKIVSLEKVKDNIDSILTGDKY